MFIKAIVIPIIIASFIQTSWSRLLTLNDFDNLIKQKKHLFIFFHSETCDQCPKLTFNWQILEKRIQSFKKSKLVIGNIHCDLQKSLCKRERVKLNEVQPTIRLYIPQENEKHSETLYEQSDYELTSFEGFLRVKLPINIIEGDNYQHEHNGLVTSDDDPESGFKQVHNNKIMMQWLLRGFYELSDEDFTLFLSVKGENLVYFYSPWCRACHQLEIKWESLIKSIDLRLTRFSRINCVRHPYACKFYQVEDYPTVMWISNGKIKQRYKNIVEDFIPMMKHLISVIEDPERHDRLPINLNTEDFRSMINIGHHLIHFTVPWSKHCKSMANDWAELPFRIDNPTVKIATVDCSVNEVLCDVEQVDAYPTIYLYFKGNRLGEYNGSRTVDAILKYLNKFVKIGKKDEL